MRVMLRVAYDGTGYSGWQKQPNAFTVEEVLCKACKNLFARDIDIIGASRTDAGVHSYGNVAVFDVDTRIPAEKISYALNSRLPEDIRVVESRQVSENFHPRHVECRKTYEYKIWNDKFENPLVRYYSHFFYGNLDIGKMNEACRYFIGLHDFTSFCSVGSQVQSKIREIYSISVEKNNRLITIRVTGNGFLYNMVRIIAGTLIKVGQGQLEPAEIPKIIEGKNRELAGPTAPARGLALVEINYEKTVDTN